MTTARRQDFLSRHAAPRAGTVDDHMFTVERTGYSPATFRLQLFTAPGVRPVAVLTQTDREGTSLSRGPGTLLTGSYAKDGPLVLILKPACFRASSWLSSSCCAVLHRA